MLVKKFSNVNSIEADKRLQFFFLLKLCSNYDKKSCPEAVAASRGPTKYLAQFNSESIILRILIENPVHSQTCCMDKKNINCANA